jgi:hypothetical protein
MGPMKRAPAPTAKQWGTYHEALARPTPWCANGDKAALDTARSHAIYAPPKPTMFATFARFVGSAMSARSRLLSTGTWLRSAAAGQGAGSPRAHPDRRSLRHRPTAATDGAGALGRWRASGMTPTELRQEILAVDWAICSSSLSRASCFRSGARQKISSSRPCHSAFATAKSTCPVAPTRPTRHSACCAASRKAAATRTALTGCPAGRARDAGPRD